jgi:tRNA dimethylallyltransferase
VVRALERATVHGDTPPPTPQGYPARHVWLGLQLDAVSNRAWIEERARSQFANGLLEEGAALREQYDPSLRAFSAVGYREAFSVLDGRATREEAIQRVMTRTNQFAKRQRTWFRAERGINWLDATTPSLHDEARKVVEASL